jgi:hypothetical protein
MTSEQVAEAIQLAYQSLKRDSFFWASEVPGYVHVRMFEPLKIVSRIHGGDVVERDGLKLLYDSDGRLVPRLGGRPGDFDNVYDDDKAEPLIAKASDGDQMAHNVLCSVAARFVESGCAMPSRLRAYIAGTLSSQFRKAPQRHRGPDPYANYIRDGDVARVIGEVVKLGFRPTRNRATTEAESACSIVAKALTKVGLNLSVPAVEKIWSASRKRPAGKSAS